MTKKITLEGLQESIVRVAASVEDLAVMMKEGFDGCATKEDLKQCASKDDLKRFATKEDLKRFATKEDLKRFATKEDLKDYMTRDEFLCKFDEMLTKEDEVITILKRNEAELAASQAARDRHEEKLENHEIRIKRLEKVSK